MPVDPKLNERAAAEELGIAPKTLRNWRSRGGGPRYLKLGDAVRYRLSDLRRFEDERTFDRTPARKAAS